MTILFRILRAVHANGTHHKLALDALPQLKCKNADKWQRLFLSEAALYMEGSKAPDKEFKDFKNHVLHVRDNLWGGAPAKARSWYGHLVEALREQNWDMAVYCAGVLSHYYTDPIQPFHTAQCEAENNIHRAVEWSISKSYDDLVAQTLRNQISIDIPHSEDPNWLAELVVAGATRSNHHYERLIAHYNFDNGVADPPSGLDRIARKTIGELLVYAATGYAYILDRAITEAGVAPPRVGLSASTVLAGLQIPIQWVTNKMADREEATLVRAMYDELHARGKVETTLSLDDRTVRDLYNLEVRAKRSAPTTAERFPLPQNRQRKKASLANRTAAAAHAAIGTPAPGDQMHKAPVGTDIDTSIEALVAPPTPTEPITSQSSLTQSLAQLQPRPGNGTNTSTGSSIDTSQKPGTSVPVVDRSATQLHAMTNPGPRAITRATGDTASSAQGSTRYYLAVGDDVVDAPSIGPKTAVKLRPLGIHTVADLLHCDPSDIARRASSRYITCETVIDWQDQARLVCTVPGLRGGHAQVLVGAGYREPETIAQTDQIVLLADILRFAGSVEGRRVLRDGQPPDLDKVLKWITQAQQADTARAA